MFAKKVFVSLNLELRTHYCGETHFKEWGNYTFKTHNRENRGKTACQKCPQRLASAPTWAGRPRRAKMYPLFSS